MDVSESEDPEGLRVFYYLVQDVKVKKILFTVCRVSLFLSVPRVFSHFTSFQDQTNLEQAIGVH
jgi:hypothetical protein